MNENKAATICCLSFLFAILLFGCDQQLGDVYLGRWERIGQPDITLEITREGRDFVILMKTPNLMRDWPGTKKAPITERRYLAMLEHGEVLVVGSGMQNTRIKYLQRSKTLLAPGFGGVDAEYKRP